VNIWEQLLELLIQPKSVLYSDLSKLPGNAAGGGYSSFNVIQKGTDLDQNKHDRFGCDETGAKYCDNEDE
jgi:hypothetical protein